MSVHSTPDKDFLHVWKNEILWLEPARTQHRGDALGVGHKPATPVARQPTFDELRRWKSAIEHDRDVELNVFGYTR